MGAGLDVLVGSSGAIAGGLVTTLTRAAIGSQRAHRRRARRDAERMRAQVVEIAGDLATLRARLDDLLARLNSEERGEP